MKGFLPIVEWVVSAHYSYWLQHFRKHSSELYCLLPYDGGEPDEMSCEKCQKPGSSVLSIQLFVYMMLAFFGLLNSYRGS